MSRPPRLPGRKAGPCNKLVPSCGRSAHSRAASLEQLDLGAPHVAFGLNRLNGRMQVTGVDDCLHQHVLSGGELLAQLSVLGGESEDEFGHVIVHPRSCIRNPSGRV